MCNFLLEQQNIDEKTIIKSLKKIIPSYMIPNKFLFLKIAKNPNGKIDRKEDTKLYPIMKIKVIKDSIKKNLLK